MQHPFVVYCLSGLGLGPAIFQRLTIEAQAVHQLDWLPPLSEESLTAYAKRIAAQIAPVPKHLVLIGHSFGGVLIQEISKLLSVQHLILISSIKAAEEKPFGMNVLMRVLPVHRLATKTLILNSFPYWGPHRGYETPEAQAVFKEALDQHSDYYIRWSTEQIVAWTPKNITTPITHIHGTRDRTFPFRRLQTPVLAVKGGTHFMVFNRAEQVSHLINQTLAKL